MHVPCSIACKSRLLIGWVLNAAWKPLSIPSSALSQGLASPPGTWLHMENVVDLNWRWLVAMIKAFAHGKRNQVAVAAVNKSVKSWHIFSIMGQPAMLEDSTIPFQCSTPRRRLASHSRHDVNGFLSWWKEMDEWLQQGLLSYPTVQHVLVVSKQFNPNSKSFLYAIPTLNS